VSPGRLPDGYRDQYGPGLEAASLRLLVKVGGASAKVAGSFQRPTIESLPRIACVRLLPRARAIRYHIVGWSIRQGVRRDGATQVGPSNVQKIPPA
jgi:hypothetical protein